MELQMVTALQAGLSCEMRRWMAIVLREALNDQSSAVQWGIRIHLYLNSSTWESDDF